MAAANDAMPPALARYRRWLDTEASPPTKIRRTDTQTESPFPAPTAAPSPTVPKLPPTIAQALKAASSGSASASGSGSSQCKSIPLSAIAARSKGGTGLAQVQH